MGPTDSDKRDAVRPMCALDGRDGSGEAYPEDTVNPSGDDQTKCAAEQCARLGQEDGLTYDLWLSPT